MHSFSFVFSFLGPPKEVGGERQTSSFPQAHYLVALQQRAKEKKNLEASSPISSSPSLATDHEDNKENSNKTRACNTPQSDAPTNRTVTGGIKNSIKEGLGAPCSFLTSRTGRNTTESPFNHLPRSSWKSTDSSTHRSKTTRNNRNHQQTASAPGSTKPRPPSRRFLTVLFPRCSFTVASAQGTTQEEKEVVETRHMTESKLLLRALLAAHSKSQVALIAADSEISEGRVLQT